MTNRETIKRLTPTLGKPGLKTKRACDIDDIKLCIKSTKNAKRRVRVYSSEGFVPHSYKYRCDIQYVEAAKNAESGEWEFRTGWCGAQRSHGNGSLLVVE